MTTCSFLARDEPLAGTAPTDIEWLFVEDPGPWEPKVRLKVPGARVQLIRRHGRRSPSDGVRLFAATLGDPVSVRTAIVASAASIADAAWTPYDEPLLFVCTHGRRDRCCSERGRPVAAALADRWPEPTWETTHLGGHRFAGTLLALPSGVALGRLDATDAVSACAALLEGRLPLEVVRGRAGRPGEVQAAELAVRRARGLSGLAEVSVSGTDGDRVTLDTPTGPLHATVTTGRGEARPQSCGDDKQKAAPTYDVVLGDPPAVS